MTEIIKNLSFLERHPYCEEVWLHCYGIICELSYIITNEPKTRRKTPTEPKRPKEPAMAIHVRDGRPMMEPTEP